MVFIDFVKHLQEILDSISAGTFDVSNTRDMVGNTEKVSVVVTALSGSVYNNSASIPYQIEIFSNDPDYIQTIFTGIAKEKNGKSFIQVIQEGEEAKEYTCFEYFNTPAVADKNYEFGTNRYCQLISYCTVNVLFEVGNVSKLKVNNEEVEFNLANVNYATELYPYRTSGNELNFAIKKSSTTTLSITMVNKTSLFTNKIFDIMFGKAKGNTVFSVEITLTNGRVETCDMILSSNSFNSAKNSPSLPSLNIVLAITQTI